MIPEEQPKIDETAKPEKENNTPVPNDDVLGTDNINPKTGENINKFENDSSQRRL